MHHNYVVHICRNEIGSAPVSHAFEISAISDEKATAIAVRQFARCDGGEITSSWCRKVRHQYIH